MKERTIEEQLANSRKEGECIVYLGYINNRGYGRFCANGKLYLAHRASYEFHKGKLTLGKFICHTCDNRKCINPDHLYEGSYKENNRDRYKNVKRRSKKLADHLSHLSCVIPREIHEMILEDANQNDLKIKEYITKVLKSHFNIKE